MKIDIDDIEKQIRDHITRYDKPMTSHNCHEFNNALRQVLLMFEKQKEVQPFYNVVDEIRELDFVRDVTIENYIVMVRVSRWKGFRDYKGEVLAISDNLKFICGLSNVYSEAPGDLMVFEWKN